MNLKKSQKTSIVSKWTSKNHEKPQKFQNEPQKITSFCNFPHLSIYSNYLFFKIALRVARLPQNFEFFNSKISRPFQTPNKSPSNRKLKPKTAPRWMTQKNKRKRVTPSLKRQITNVQQNK
jgi:hypothetical protein